MQKIKAFFHILFNVGVKDDYALSERTRIQNLNKICLIIGFVVLGMMFVASDSSPAIISLIAYAICFFSVYIFHYFKKYTLYNTFLTLTVGILNTIIGACFEKRLGVEIYFIVTFVAILYHFNEHKYRALNVAFTIVCFLITMYMQFYEIHFFPAPQFSSYVFFTNMIVGLAFLYFIVVNFRKTLQKSQVAIEEQNQLLAFQKAELQDSNNIKDKLFSIIGHDLRAPLTSISGFLALLEMNYLDENQREVYLQKLRNSILGSSQTLDNLSLWYIQSQKNIIIQKEKIQVVDVLETVFKTLSILAEQKNIELSHSIPNDLYIAAAPNFLPFILRNLVSNALKFTPKGGKIHVEYHLYQELCISVKDTGIGIKKEKLSKLFDMEAQFSTLGTEKEKGTGLGLPLCKEFAEKNGSRIWVESEEGKGSTFYFSLPQS